MERTWGARGASALLLAIAALALGAGCGEEEAAGAGAEQTVADFVEGWARVSGVERDPLSATHVKMLLAGDLRGQTDGAKPGATPGQDAAHGRRISGLLNDLVGLPLPPDQGLEVLDTVAANGEARVIVRLQYSANAAGIAAAEGLLPFDALQEAHGVVIVQPTRTFVLSELNGSWRIVGIDR